MNVGIIGLPQVGKRTIFKLLTGLSAEKAPSRHGIRYGMASVHDPRVDVLSEMYNPKKTRYAEFEIALPSDVQPQASRSADWMAPLRTGDVLLHVVRAFAAPGVFHVEGSVDPARDMDLVDTEFLFADLDLVETRLARMDKSPTAKDSASQNEKKILERCKAHLEAGQPLRTLELQQEDLKVIAGLQFLTLKPLLVVFNVDEDLSSETERLAPLSEIARAQGAHTVCLSAAIEAEIAELPPAEREAFMQEMGFNEPATHVLSRAMFECLGLMTFFTVGQDEVRGWPVRLGSTAPVAAGKIHSDLQRGFIRAETIAYSDLIEAGSEKAAREAGCYALKGKEYEVQDGDIMEIRFSV